MMDINCICPAYKCNIMEFLPYFLDVDEYHEDIKIAPSRLLHELQMSTEERLERLCRPTRRKKSATQTNSFSAIPDIVIFQNFQAGHIYKAKLTLQNLQPVSRHLTIIQNCSPYFEVIYSDDSSSVKVAPGMTFSINVVFKPVEFRDHVFGVQFRTEGETFSVPVHGLGQRPFLSLPDHVSLSPTAIRVPSHKSIVLHNFGQSQTCFVASCQEPCKVFPVRGSLKPNQIIELKITCTPTNSKSVSIDLLFNYEDIKLIIPMTCTVVKADVYLDTSSVIFDETYMGLQSHRKLSAYNCSQFTVEFKWKTCKSNAMEELEKSKLVNAMSDLAGLEKKKNVKLEYMNIIDAEGHSAIIDQELARQIKDMENQFLFGNTIFSVLPVEGKMLPNQCLEFTIIFSPQKSDYYTDFAYFDVTGREDRIVLCLSGGGRGPQVVFNAKTLNANDIFLDGTHEYQIVAKNDGNIPAVVSFVEKDTEFGGVIKCMPKRQYLYSRDICKSFVISFCSKFQGQFVEKIQFMIDESKELIDVLFVGNVICPLLKPDIQDIDFGEVSFGSQPSKELVLTNDSQVPIDFRLYIPGNKQQNGKEEFDEFEFSPREGVVEAFSSSVIKVTLTTQALRDIDETLMVSMWGSQRYSIQLPLRYNCVCPTIKCTPEEVFISFCFLNYEYKRTIILKNCSSVSGVLTYTPLENPSNITCILNKTEFFVFPNEEIEIELTIQTDKLGTHEFPLIFTMAGSSPESICTVICNGQGPVVSYEPDELQFESIILLHEVSKMLTLINDSPIIANITVSTSPTSPFASDVAHLEIAPEDRRELTVRGYLTDTGRYKESLNIEIENGEIVAIPILGEGVGSSILCEPIIDPEYDAGILLTHQIFKLKVKFTNLGKKRYKISWTRRQGLKNLKELDDEDVYASVFRIEPVRFELGRNESQQIEIIGSSKKPQGVQEDFYCFALIDKSTKLTNIMSCLMKAEFVEPNVQFSDWTLNFLCATEDYPTFFRKPQPSSLTPMVDYEEFYRPPVDTTGLVITNDTELPLKLVMKTTSDYYINNDGEMMTEMGYELNAGDNYNAQIEFRPKSQSKRYSKKNGRFTVDFSQHPKEDNITLIGEVMYPTINLVPDKYHFECLPLDSYTCTTILIQNVTFMPLEYSWELLEDGFEIENLEVLADYDNTCIRSSMKSIESDDINKLEEITSVAAASQPKFNMSHIKKSASKVHSSHLHNKKVVSMANIPSKLIAKNRGLTEHSQKDLTKRESSVASEKLLKTVLLDDEQTGSAEEIHIDWDYKTYDMEATKFIKNIAINHLVQEDTEFFCDIENEASSAYSIGNIVTIEPSNGVLAPFEYGAVTIGFFPPPNVKVKCTAICKVEGGEDEPFLITGMSSRISYKFDKQVIEFGRRLFSEILESTLLLTNNGYSKFHFKKICDEQFEYLNVPPGWLCVNPSEGCLLAGESVTLLIKYFPGKTGEFQETIVFEIGYLEPYEVQVHGYASFPQLSLTLPREIVANNWNDLSYRAISSITEEYLLSFSDVKNENITKYVHKRGCPENMNEAAYKSLLRDDWVIISDNDVYPTETEIDLSRERTLLNEYLRSKSFISTQSVTRKVDTISEFIVSPYLLDFGYVIMNKPVCYTVLILNCGPVDTEVRLEEINRSRLDNNELKIEFRTKRMGVGDMTELYVIFSPTRKRCGPHERCIEECIFLTVKNGGKIPILIRATATIPTMNIGYSCIEFGTVKIGSALRKSIIIQNDGNLLSKWTTEVRSLNNQIDNAYHIIPNKGELLPGKKDLLNIYWVPTKKGANDSELTIRIERNNVNTSVELYGHAIEPTLAFSELKLDFDASLPYSEKIEKYLIIQNASTFPVEYCFSDFDRDYDEEKHYIALYLLYHNYDSVLIPERLPGCRLPDMFQSNYYFLMNQIKEKLLSTEKFNEIEGSFDLNARYDKEEIFRLILEHIETIPGCFDDSNTDVCPLDDEINSRMAIINPEIHNVDDSDERSGVFIIFHGGPHTNYYRAANRVGIALSMQVYSIDRLISEELVKNEVGPAAEINSIIQSALQGYNMDNEKQPEEDDYDFLWRKIRTFLDKKRKPSSGKLQTSAAKSRSSERGSDKKSDKSNAIPSNTITLMDIATELLIDLLRRRFDNTKSAVIIESLNSEFLRKPNIALDCLLHAIGSVKYIHIIILSYTLEDYMDNELTRLKNEAEAVADIDDVGTPKTGKGSTKKIKQEPSKNFLKQITKDLQKDLKSQFESFRNLLEEILHICEFWERHCQVLIRPFSKGNLTSKKDTKSSAKESAPESKSSNKKGRKIVSSSTGNFSKVNFDALGIRLWAISNCNDDRITDLEIIPTMLKCSPELNEVILELEGQLERIEESTTTFSVVRQMKYYKKNLNKYFKICQPTIEKIENTVHLATSSAGGSLRKKSSKRKASAERKENMSSTTTNSGLRVTSNLDAFSTRYVLSPSDKTKYEITFSPAASGKYTYNYLIELVGIDRPYTIQCTASCQLPEISWNPEIVFPKYQDAYQNKILGENFVYYNEEDVFDFGYIFIGTHKTLPYATKIMLQNASALPCEITAQLAENSLFVIEKEKLSIKPQESEEFPMSLKAAKKGRIQSELFITIKYNPKVKVIRLAAQACPVEFNVQPKALSFEKVPLHYSDKRKITLTNSSPVNLVWKFVKAEWTLDIYNISKMSGAIKLYSVDEIIIEYFPTNEETNPKKSFEIQVFDLNHSDIIPIYKEDISVVSESVVYQVEYKSHIDLGDVRGRSQMKIPFHMSNNGKCNVSVVFSELDNILPGEMHVIRKFFKMSIKSEVLLPQKSAAVMITFHPTMEMNFENVPVYNCSFVENNKPENVISSFVITFSGVVHLSKFELCPASDLYFGYQQVGTAKSQKMEIKNTGRFSFEYAILSFDETVMGQMKKHKADEQKVKSSMDVFKRMGSIKSRTASPKNKEKSKTKEKPTTKASTLEVEGFSIDSSTGVVLPNEKVQINVEYIPKEMKEYDRILVIFVTECQKEDLYGRKFILHGEGTQPSCNFDDYEKMFREHFIVRELGDFTSPENIGSHSVFVASETALYLKNICMNENYTMKIYLQNLGQVIAEAAVKLEQKNDFTVSPSTLFIPPYETETIFITFTPDSINKFENKLIISYNSSVSNTFVLSLNAESCVPQISLLEPKTGEDNITRIDFIPTYIGMTRSRRICVENIGAIPCKLIMDLCDDKYDVFHLVTQDDDDNILKQVENEEDVDNPLPSFMVNLLTKRKGYFDLVFKPSYERFFNVQMKIHTVNNPFEIITIDITGQSYCRDIYVDGLETLNLNKSTSSTPYIGYILDFGFSSLNKLLKKCFTLKNNSQSNIYKFQFTQESTVIVTPRVGHLKPNTSKEIIAVISTKLPLCLQNVKIECNFMIINYVNSDTSISWDDRQQIVEWEHSKQNDSIVRPQYYKEAINIAMRELSRSEYSFEENNVCILYRPEPEHILSTNVWDIIPIFLSVTADYASYDCAVRELIFPDTFVKEVS
ncbi:unnamed protein product [Phaedon cochleariae]|uniref:HYDIN/VesB/CFA65-like Ig-like domain-containing protein n=1 Tax=Phaedon cochleariae TaxID=80249 RepID=A0A9N9SMV7_PHACE|nr:unnamed protein product [Phaedon cochleariae]